MGFLNKFLSLSLIWHCLLSLTGVLFQFDQLNRIYHCWNKGIFTRKRLGLRKGLYFSCFILQIFFNVCVSFLFSYISNSWLFAVLFEIRWLIESSKRVWISTWKGNQIDFTSIYCCEFTLRQIVTVFVKARLGCLFGWKLKLLSYRVFDFRI